MPHDRAERFLSGHKPGTQRTYSFQIADHLSYLRARRLHEETVEFRHLQQYMGACGADYAGPLLGVWLEVPLTVRGLGVRAAAVKGYYLNVLRSESLNPELLAALDRTNLPSKADQQRSRFDGRSNQKGLKNPLAPPTPPRRDVRLLPDGTITQLLQPGVLKTARDIMIVTWLADMGPRIGELCGLRFCDLHLRTNHTCGERREPHIHIVKRDDNSNRARAKRGSAGSVTGGVVRGGTTRRVSPAMIDTYNEYLTTDYYRLRAMTTSDLVLVRLANDAGQPLTTHGARQMLYRASARAKLGKVNPHAFRHHWATALAEATGGDARAVAAEGGWASAETVERTYVHLANSPALDQALVKVWERP